MLDRTIEKCTYIAKNGTRQEVYRITEYGKIWIGKHIANLSDRKFYTSTGTEHDLKIMDKILTLSKEERLTMRCEAEIRDSFKAMLNQLLEDRNCDRYNKLYTALQEHTISMPDLAYGEKEYYETITNSYGQAEIQAKIEAVALIGGNLQMEKI